MKLLSRFIAGAALAVATSITFAADIVDTAVSAGQFKTLVKAVQEAGLVATLKGKGPYTVFAPTDEAFAKLPAGTLDALLKDKQKLTAILTYHVVPGKLMAVQVKPGQIKTVEGQSLTISTNERRRHGGQRQGREDRHRCLQRRNPRDRHRRPAELTAASHNPAWQDAGRDIVRRLHEEREQSGRTKSNSL